MYNIGAMTSTANIEALLALYALIAAGAVSEDAA